MYSRQPGKLVFPLRPLVWQAFFWNGPCSQRNVSDTRRRLYYSTYTFRSLDGETLHRTWAVSVEIAASRSCDADGASRRVDMSHQEELEKAPTSCTADICDGMASPSL